MRVNSGAGRDWSANNGTTASVCTTLVSRLSPLPFEAIFLRCLFGSKLFFSRAMSLSSFKALTFDCYGTLIDWEHVRLNLLFASFSLTYLHHIFACHQSAAID